jgi:hypothetical protein
MMTLALELHLECWSLPTAPSRSHALSSFLPAAIVSWPSTLFVVSRIPSCVVKVRCGIRGAESANGEDDRGGGE